VVNCLALEQHCPEAAVLAYSIDKQMFKAGFLIDIGSISQEKFPHHVF
jgi:hypothetical protein